MPIVLTYVPQKARSTASKFDNVLSPGSPTGVVLQKSTVVHDDSVSLCSQSHTGVFDSFLVVSYRSVPRFMPPNNQSTYHFYHSSLLTLSVAQYPVPTLSSSHQHNLNL